MFRFGGGVLIAFNWESMGVPTKVLHLTRYLGTPRWFSKPLFVALVDTELAIRLSNYNFQTIKYEGISTLAATKIHPAFPTSSPPHFRTLLPKEHVV